MPRVKTKWWQILLMVGVSTLLPFLMLEGWLRLSPILHGPEVIPSPIPGVAYTYFPNRTYRAILPGQEPLRVNKWGTLGDDFPLEKDPGEFRIFVVGDSIVLSQHYFHTGFVKTLQKRFDENPPLPGRKFRVVQAGIASHSTCQEKQLIKHAYDRFEPDLIVIGYALNDTEGPRVPFGLDIETGELAWWATGWAFLKNRFRLVNWFKHHLSPLVVRLHGPGAGVAPKGADPTDEIGYVTALHDPNGPLWKPWEACVGELGDYRREKKTPILFAVFPMLKPFDDARMREVYDRVAGAAAKAGLETLNLYPAFAAAGAATTMYGVDKIHLNQGGHDVAAAALEKAIRERPGLLSGRGR